MSEPKIEKIEAAIEAEKEKSDLLSPTDAEFKFLDETKREEILERHPGMTLQEIHQRLGQELFEQRYGPLREFLGEEKSFYDRKKLVSKVNILSALLRKRLEEKFKNQGEELANEEDTIEGYERSGHFMKPALRKQKLLELEHVIMQSKPDQAAENEYPLYLKLLEFIALSRVEGDQDVD